VIAQNKNERRILLFSNVGHFLVHSIILIFPSVVTPISKDFSLNFAETIKISFPMYLLYGLGALPTGFVIDHLKPKISYCLYFGGVFLFTFISSFTRAPMELRISLAILGIFLSMYHPLGLGLISTNIKNRGMALGLNGIFGSLGLALSPFIAGVINYWYGWRKVYRFISLIPLLMFLMLLILDLKVVSNKKRDQQNISKENGESSLVPFIILLISMCLAGFVYRGQTIIMPTYFEKKVYFLFDLIKKLNIKNFQGAKTLSATTLTSLVYGISIIGQLGGGKIANKYRLDIFYFYFLILALPFLIMMYFFENILLFISSIFFILFTVGMQPIENSLVASFTPDKWRSTSYGFKFVLTFGVGSLVIYPVGYIQERYSISAVFIMFIGVIIILAINNYLLIKVSRRYRAKVKQ